MRADPVAADSPGAALPTLALRAAAALAGTADATRLAVLLGWPVHEVQAALVAAVPELPGSGSQQDDLAPVAAWFRQAPQAAASAVDRALALHLQQGRVERAAPIALGFGSPAQRLALLAQAGWSLLWRPERPLLGQLLDSVAMEPAAERGPVLALRLAWWIEVERVPHVADRRLQQGAELPAADVAMFRSRIAQVFDEARGALALAREAVAGHPNDLQPPALLARYALGFALLDAGHPREALAPLADVVRGSARDGLPMLALDALAVQARAHDELADVPALQATLAAARMLARQHALSQLPALHGLERQRRSLALRRVFAAPADVPVNGAEPAVAAPADALSGEPDPGAYEAFPSLVIEALAALQAGALDRAGELLAALDRRLALAFHCAKWRNGHLLARLWWLSRRPDGAALAALQAPPAPIGEDATLVELHHAVLQAAAAQLAGRAWHPAAVEPLQRCLEARGLLALQRRLLLLRAIGPPADADALLSWLTLSADGQVQDALWHAPKLATVLEALLSSVAIVRHPAERLLAQRLFQHMQALPGDAARAEGPGAASPPPADLTLREWEILQLIGQHYTNEQIAARLNVSIATVKTHINRVYGKLGIGSRAEAVQRAHHLA